MRIATIETAKRNQKLDLVKLRQRLWPAAVFGCTVFARKRRSVFGTTTFGG
jgi:hypothetical protein